MFLNSFKVNYVLIHVQEGRMQPKYLLPSIYVLKQILRM